MIEKESVTNILLKPVPPVSGMTKGESKGKLEFHFTLDDVTLCPGVLCDRLKNMLF